MPWLRDGASAHVARATALGGDIKFLWFLPRING